jgi:hypothetical protein
MEQGLVIDLLKKHGKAVTVDLIREVIDLLKREREAHVESGSHETAMGIVCAIAEIENRFVVGAKPVFTYSEDFLAYIDETLSFLDDDAIVYLAHPLAKYVYRDSNKVGRPAVLMTEEINEIASHDLCSRIAARGYKVVNLIAVGSSVGYKADGEVKLSGWNASESSESRAMIIGATTELLLRAKQQDVLIVVSRMDGEISRGCIAEAGSAADAKIKVIYFRP